MKTRLFISYSHKDTETVTSIVQKLALCGYKVWMDVKDINPGDDYTLKISEGVHSSDVYVVFLTKASVESRYVNVELSWAVNRAVNEPQFKIIPILLEKTSIPDVISHLDFIDASSISSSVINQINGILKSKVSNPISKLTLQVWNFH